MKKIFVCMTVAAALFAAGCSPYDDTELKQQVKGLDTRLTELETLVANLNKNLGAMMTTVSAFENQERITSVIPLEDGTGFVVTFTKSGSVTIKNGKDGDAPVMSVKQAEDGLFYWTAYGKFVVDDNGQKISATAALPQIRINGDNFELSFDGTNWKVIGYAGGAGVIKELQDGSDAVTFILPDGNTIVIPKQQSFGLFFERSRYGILPGMSLRIPFTVTSADEGTVVKGFGPDGFKTFASFIPVTGKGSLTLTAPKDGFTGGDFYCFAISSKGTTSVRVLTIEHGNFYTDMFDDHIPKEGKTITFKARTNYDFTVEFGEASSWMHLVDIKKGAEPYDPYEITVRVDKNDYVLRDGHVLIKVGWDTVATVVLHQDGGDNVPADGSHDLIDDWKDSGETTELN